MDFQGRGTFHAIFTSPRKTEPVWIKPFIHSFIYSFAFSKKKATFKIMSFTYFLSKSVNTNMGFINQEQDYFIVTLIFLSSKIFNRKILYFHS